MQTLILFSQQQTESVWEDYGLDKLFACIPATCLLDSVENLLAKGGRIYTNGYLGRQLLARKTELFPSFVLFADRDNHLYQSDAYTRINKVLSSGHPYCQQLLFHHPSLRQVAWFFTQARAQDPDGQPKCRARAIVHIASLEVRRIVIHQLTLSGENCPDAHDQKAIALQLEYLFAQMYAAIIRDIDYDAAQESDKSICFQVDFDCDFQVDIRLVICEIQLIHSGNFSQFPLFLQALPDICHDLLLLKQEKNASLGSNNKHYIRACHELGLYCEPITRNKYLIKKGDRKAIYIPYHRTLQQKQAIERASSKAATNQMLQQQGFRVNKSLVFHVQDMDETRIKQVFQTLSPPFVIKPTDQSAGYGVYLNIHNKELFARVLTQLRALEKIGEIVVEEQFDGAMYRFLVIGDQVQAVLKSHFPVLYGNGRDTLQQLIRRYNQINRRKIRVNDSMQIYFESLGLSLKDRPAKGQQIIASLKKIGDVTQDVTDVIHPRFKKIAVDANRASGLVINGVDMMIARDGDYRIIELNPVPALYQHLAPDYGRSRDMFRLVMEYLLDHASHDILDCHPMCDYHE